MSGRDVYGPTSSATTGATEPDTGLQPTKGQSTTVEGGTLWPLWCSAFSGPFRRKNRGTLLEDSPSPLTVYSVDGKPQALAHVTSDSCIYVAFVLKGKLHHHVHTMRLLILWDFALIQNRTQEMTFAAIR